VSGAVRRRPLSWLGAGLITGAADDDPSGIATYSQAGAQLGYGACWTLLFTYPLMVGIQLASARIGRVTGEGLAVNFALLFPRAIVYPLVALLVVANVINLGADINAMADALHTVMGGPTPLYAIAVGTFSLALQTFATYERYVRVLKWLTLVLIAYVGVAVVAHVDWRAAASGLLIPRVEWTMAYWTTIAAILGTTISPYLFFWQAQQEVEDIGCVRAAKPGDTLPVPFRRVMRRDMRRIRLDTIAGMGASNLVAFFIMVSAAATLHRAGVHDVLSTSDAAKALEPIAGHNATLLFALGLVGTGLLALPVLAGSAAYAVAGLLHVRRGLRETVRTAPAFYAILTASMVVGIGLSLVGFEPIRMLVWTAVLNAAISVPIMIAVMVTASSTTIMRDMVIGRRTRILGWAATAAMAAASVAAFSALILTP
jgi:Mn2+/Fe2+ NRAMP family transporter